MSSWFDVASPADCRASAQSLPDGAVHRNGGAGGRAQASFWQRVAGLAQGEQAPRVEGEPDLIGMGDTAIATGRSAAVPEVQA